MAVDQFPSPSRLTNIQKIALALKQRCAKSLNISPDTPRTLTVSRPSYHLPPASSIYDQLVNHGASTQLATIMSDAYLRHASEWSRRTSTIIEQTWENLARTPFLEERDLHYRQQAFVNKCVHLYERQLCHWESLAVSVLTTRASRPSPRPVQFNQHFVPFLEMCFEEDAYPSQADRALFARKSMMTPRQIEVWFQNHRRRARKEGRPVVRRRPDDRSRINLDSLAKSMPDLFIPEAQRSELIESDWDDDDDNTDDVSEEEDAPVSTERHRQQLGAADTLSAADTLNVRAPLHAFPTVFSECRNYHPFPTTDDGFTFPPPVWMRKPATQRVNRSSPDFEDLTARFERLSLLTPLMTGSRKTGSGKHSRPTSIETSPPKRKYPLPTTFTPVTPPSGRHPAFVPTPSESRVSLSTSKPTMPIVRAPDSRLHAFQTPAPESPPASLLPPSAPVSSLPVYKKTPPRRQVARLPRRTPQSQSVAHRTSPIQTVTSPSSPSPSSVSSGSRTSSFESLFSSHTRTSSSGSDTSLPNMPITPTFSPTPLQPPAPVTATDFSFTDDLFGDSLFDLSFPPNAFQLNGFGNASKPIQTPSYNDFNFNFTPSQFLQA